MHPLDEATVLAGAPGDPVRRGRTSDAYWPSSARSAAPRRRPRCAPCSSILRAKATRSRSPSTSARQSSAAVRGPPAACARQPLEPALAGRVPPGRKTGCRARREHRHRGAARELEPPACERAPSRADRDAAGVRQQPFAAVGRAVRLPLRRRSSRAERDDPRPPRPARAMLWLRTRSRARSTRLAARDERCVLRPPFQVSGRIPPFGTVSMTTYFDAAADELAAHGEAPLEAFADATCSIAALRPERRAVRQRRAALRDLDPDRVLPRLARDHVRIARRGGRHAILRAMRPIEPQAIDPATRQALDGVTTATLTTVLLKKGLRNVWIRGARPLAERLPERRVGRAFTLRFVPAREDLATPASWASPISTRAAIEAMPAGAIAVVDAMGVTDAGIFGDILCARMAQARRRRARHRRRRARPRGRARHGLPVWCQGAAAPASVDGPHLRRLAGADRLRRRRRVCPTT